MYKEHLEYSNPYQSDLSAPYPNDIINAARLGFDSYACQKGKYQNQLGLGTCIWTSH